MPRLTYGGRGVPRSPWSLFMSVIGVTSFSGFPTHGHSLLFVERTTKQKKHKKEFK